MNRHDRSITLAAGNGWTFVNVELVRRGVAQAATYPSDIRYADYFLTAERGARSAGVGLWAPSPEATPAPTPPPTAAPVVTRVPVANCQPSCPCLPIVADLDCPDVRTLGAAPVNVTGPDAYRLDGDHDGIGCE